MKESPEGNMTNAGMPTLRTQRKGCQKFMATNIADITVVNEKEITDPEPYHHPALALRMTELTTRIHIMSMAGYQPLTVYLPFLKNS